MLFNNNVLIVPNCEDNRQTLFLSWDTAEYSSIIPFLVEMHVNPAIISQKQKGLVYLRR